MRKFIFSILLVFISFFSFGQKLKFVPMSCVVSKGEKDTIEKIAQFELAFYSGIFSIQKVPPIRIAAYGNYEKFKRAQEKTPGYAQSEEGFFTPANCQVTVLKDANFIGTCCHEMNHFFFHVQLNHIPIWINEGLSCYFGNAKIDTSGTVQINPWNYANFQMKQLLSKKKFHFEWLVSCSQKKFYRRNKLDHYVEAWAIIYFLMTKNHEIVKNVIGDIKAGYSSLESLNKEYIGGTEQLQKDVSDYYK